MPIEDFGLSPEEQLRLHDLTEQAVGARPDPFGEPPTLDVSVPNSLWDTVDTAPVLSDSVLDEANTGFNTTVVEEPDSPQQEEEIAEEQQSVDSQQPSEPAATGDEFQNTDSEVRGEPVDVDSLNEDLDDLLHNAPSVDTGTTHNTGVADVQQISDILLHSDATRPGEENMITPNQPSVFTEDNTARFSSAIWYENIRSKVIILAGVGGIGSWTALLLGRLQPKALFMYDNDTVEAVNMAGQLYSTDDIGSSKADAIANTIKKYSAYNSAFAMSQLYTEESEPADIMICGFDNMRARKLFFRKWKTHVMNKPDDEAKSHCLFIDGRLAAEELQVFCITGDNLYQIEQYEAGYLFDDSQAEATVCSYKQTAFVANMIAGIMVNLLVNFAANECNPPMPRSLPFKTIYNAEMMFFTTEEE